MLDPLFAVKRVSERLFVTWSTLNWKGKLISLSRLALLRAGIHGKDETIWFDAVKDEPGR